MKHLRLCSQLGALTLVVAAAWVALLHPYKATANDGNPGSAMARAILRL
jgi:hypothetical protein